MQCRAITKKLNDTGYKTIHQLALHQVQHTESETIHLGILVNHKDHWAICRLCANVINTIIVIIISLFVML